MGKRILIHPKHSVIHNRVPGVLYGFQDDNLVVSEEHSRNSKGVYVTGGPFYVRHRRVNPLVGRNLVWKWYDLPVEEWTPSFGPKYTTPVVPVTGGAAQQAATIALADTWAFGATGWKRTVPGRQKVNVTAFAGELVTGLPTLPIRLMLAVLKSSHQLRELKRSYGKAYKASGEYLNWQFGWIPLVSDLQKMYKTYQNIDKLLAQIQRDNNRGIRRRTTLRDSTNKTVGVWNYGTPFVHAHYTPPFLPPGSTRWEEVTTTVDKIWYSARYRYYIPDVGSSEWTREATNALFGLIPTPDTVYQLLPWSWLLDYFGNLGDLVANQSTGAVENLTADYAYIMRTLETTYEVNVSTTWESRINPVNGSNVPGGSLHLSAVTDSTIVKTRAAATPYGFGLTFDGLSAYQKSILAALGISRSRFL